MKKNTIFALVAIISILFSSLSFTAALAKEPKTLDVSVRNSTASDVYPNALVTITLTSIDGSSTFTFEPGVDHFSIPEGEYQYYAVTRCGNHSGNLNLNRHKILLFTCSDEELDIAVIVPHPLVPAPGAPLVPTCGANEFWHWFGSDAAVGHWHPHVDTDYGGVQSDANGHWEPRCSDGAVIES